jgi:hypothetical protein
MAITSTRWLADYLVESELLLKADADKVTYLHPEGLFEVHLRNAPLGADGTGFLSVQMIVPAADIQTAERSTQVHLDEFLHLLSFITSTSYRISRPLHLTDWTPGQHERQQYVYTRHTEHEVFNELSTELFDTAHLLQTWGVTPVLERSLRWYSAAVRARVMDDQFQFFWFVIELISEATKTTARVPDRCPKCGGELYCNSCQNISTHRPFPTQAIRSLLETLNIPSEIIDDLFTIRNGLMHGETRQAIEEKIQKRVATFTFDKTVDIIGKCAWTAILNTFVKPPGVHNPQFLHVSTFVDWHMSAKAHLKVFIPGDVNDPKIENVVLPTVSIVTYDRHQDPPRPRHWLAC